MPIPDGSSRFDRCRCALTAPLEGGAPAPIPYRRCPVGVIADVDCPEFAGARCGYFEDRGDAAPASVPRTEVPMLAAELAVDFLTPRYRRRLAALRDGAAPVPGVRAGREPAGLVVPALGRGAPINVPADRPPGSRGAAGRERAAPESQGPADAGGAGGRSP